MTSQTHTPRRQRLRLPVRGLVAVAAMQLALSACSSVATNEITGEVPDDYRRTHAIAIEENLETMDIPVIICSVIRDAELAQALGAAGFLPKPVRRAEFIQGLDQAMASLIATDAAAGS